MRVTAKAIRFLVLIVQRYHTTGTTGSAIGSAIGSGQEGHNDFTNESMVVQGEAFGESGGKIWPRPKSAGFTIMAILLDKSRSRLLETLLSLLHELLGHSLETSRLEESQSVCATAVDLMARLKTGISLAGNYLAGNYLAGSSVEYDLTNMGGNRNECDGAHWKEVCISTIISLFYEISIREMSFLHHVNTAVEPLSLFLAESARLECIPVLLAPLARLLGWYVRHHIYLYCYYI